MEDKLLQEDELEAIAKAWKKIHVRIGLPKADEQVYIMLAYMAAGLRQGFLENTNAIAPNLTDKQIQEAVEDFHRPMHLVEDTHQILEIYAKQLMSVWSDGLRPAVERAIKDMMEAMQTDTEKDEESLQ